jgi:hypothetical protein
MPAGRTVPITDWRRKIIVNLLVPDEIAKIGVILLPGMNPENSSSEDERPITSIYSRAWSPFWIQNKPESRTVGFVPEARGVCG